LADGEDSCSVFVASKLVTLEAEANRSSLRIVAVVGVVKK
jgi:hypothetical protein